MDQLLSLDRLAQAATGTANTSLYTEEEKNRLQELVAMDVDLETAAELYHDIASQLEWPMTMSESGESHHPNGAPGDDDDAVWEWLEAGVEDGGVVLSEVRGNLSEESQKIQAAATRRRQDPEVQRLEKFLAGGIEYMLAYYGENQSKKLAVTGPKSPINLSVTIGVKDETAGGTTDTVLDVAVSSRKKNLFR